MYPNLFDAEHRVFSQKCNAFLRHVFNSFAKNHDETLDYTEFIRFLDGNIFIDVHVCVCDLFKAKQSKSFLQDEDDYNLMCTSLCGESKFSFEVSTSSKHF